MLLFFWLMIISAIIAFGVYLVLGTTVPSERWRAVNGCLIIILASMLLSALIMWAPDAQQRATSAPTSRPSAEVISNATRALRPIQERYEQPTTAATLEIMAEASAATTRPAPPP